MPVLFIPSLHRKLASEAKPSDNCLNASLFMWRQFGTGKDAGKAVCIRVFRRKTLAVQRLNFKLVGDGEKVTNF